MKKAYLTILAAFTWLIVGGTILGGILALFIDPEAPEPGGLIGLITVVLLGGFGVIFLLGTARWAGAKGYPGWVGVVLGWIGPLGLIILVMLSDRTKKVESLP